MTFSNSSPDRPRECLDFQASDPPSNPSRNRFRAKFDDGSRS
jgi:hypothetical protein